MGLKSVGTLQPGNWADLVVLRANPLDNIRNTRTIDSVWIAGGKLADVSRLQIQSNHEGHPRAAAHEVNPNFGSSVSL